MATECTNRATQLLCLRVVDLAVFGFPPNIATLRFGDPRPQRQQIFSATAMLDGIFEFVSFIRLETGIIFDGRIEQENITPRQMLVAGYKNCLSETFFSGVTGYCALSPICYNNELSSMSLALRLIVAYV